MVKTIKQNIVNLISDKKFSEILVGSTWALGARVLATILGFICSVIIARSYGADSVGVVAVINSFLVLVTILAVLGTNTSILRLIPEHSIRYSPTSAFKIYQKIQFMVIGVSLITGIVFYLGADIIADNVFNKPALSFYLAIAAVFIVFKSLTLLNTAAVRALKLIRSFALMQMMPQGFNLFLLLILGMSVPTGDVPVYALLGGYALTGIAGWMIIQYAFKSRIKDEDKVHPMSSKEILSLSIPMLIAATMNNIIGQTGVLILGIFRSEAEVGYYAIAVKMTTLTVFVLYSINTVIAPKFSELYHSGQINELFRIAKKSTKLIFWSTAPIFLCLIILGKYILVMVFGPEFSNAYWLMIVLLIGQITNSICGPNSLFLNMSGEQKVVQNIMLTSAVFNITLNILLIQVLATFGAALANMISIMLWNILAMYYIKKKHKKYFGYLPFMPIAKPQAGRKVV